MMGIPVVSIYGDDRFTQGPEFLHIESMTGRADSFNGKIKPHIHRDMFQIMIAVDGDCLATVEGQSERLAGCSALYIPSGTVHGLELGSIKYGWTVTASEQLFSRHSGDNLINILDPLMSTTHVIRFDENSENFSNICWLLNRMLEEYNCSSYGRDVSIVSLLDLLMLSLAREVTGGNDEFIAESAEQKIFSRFKKQIESDYTCHYKVKYYSDRLGLTEPRLNRICQRYADKTAHEMLQARLLLEAKRLLIYSSSSATEIAFKLGFRDPAYFNRFFKRNLGISPIKFRTEGASMSQQTATSNC